MPRRSIPNEGADEDLEEVEAWNSEDASDLERPADLAKYSIVVSSRDWTVETIVSQVEHGNVDLDPAFQRRNAWRDNRRSRLIESFILGFPVPQIVLAESPRQKGTFIVIDGKQRLMTIAGLYLSAYRHYWAQARLTGLQVLADYNRVALDDFLKDIGRRRRSDWCRGPTGRPREQRPWGGAATVWIAISPARAAVPAAPAGLRCAGLGA